MIRIGNAQGFWGDRPGAAANLLMQQPNLDYLTMDYLAEVSLSILARQKAKDPQSGYAKDFLDELKSLIPFWEDDSKLKVISNAGGLNPHACALEASKIYPKKKIGVVSGDDLFSIIKNGGEHLNLDTGESIDLIRDRLITANAYLGAKGIVEALQQGADIIITGRIADPSMAVAPCIYHYGWSNDEYDKIAGATIAGHLIECGTQVTGGISTDWLNVPNPENMGYPIVEVAEDGSFVVTKPKNSGGMVTIESVKEQLLYEIGDPSHYLSPDATVSFLSLKLSEEGSDRIHVSGAKGAPPPEISKVSATYQKGYMAEGMLTLFGRDLYTKARRCGEIIRRRVENAGFELEQFHVECLGGGDLVPGVFPHEAGREVVLRIAAADSRKEALECFAKEIAPLVTSGPQGVSGYFSGRPKPRPVYGFWPTLYVKEIVPTVEIIGGVNGD